MDHQQKTFSLYAGSWLMAHAPIDLTHDMRLRNQEKKMYSGRYELCAGKCTVEGTSCVRENALWKVRLKLSLLAPYPSLQLSGGIQGLFWVVFFPQPSIPSILSNHYRLYQTNTLRCNRPSSFYSKE